MKTNRIQRITAWASAHFKRLVRRGGEATGEREAATGSRLRARLIEAAAWTVRRLSQPKGRTLVRALTFAFLVGAAYGLWQGSQELADLRSLPEPGVQTGEELRPENAVGSAEPSGAVPDAVSPAQQLATLQYVDMSGKGGVAPSAAQPPALPAILDLSQMVWPVTGRIAGPYGWYRDAATGDWRFRPGLVLKPDRDPAPVRASLPGTVVDVSTSGVGYRVVVEHAEGWQSEYVGLAALRVTVGSAVNAGDTIGEFAAAPHREGLVFIMRNPLGTADPGTFLYTPVSGS